MIAEGVRDNGLGDAGGMLFGMNMASGLNTQNASYAQPSTPAADAAATTAPTASLDEQIEALQKLKGLMDAGILTTEEFEAKKRQVLGL